MITNYDTQVISTSRQYTRPAALHTEPAGSSGAPGLVDRADIAHRPDLKEPTERAINEVNSIHGKGSGSMKLAQLVEIFGLKPTAEHQALISRRGDIQFSRTGTGGGTFSNRGDAVKVPSEEVTLKIPKEVRGTYEISPSAVAFHFDPNTRPCASKLFFSVLMDGVSADQKQIYIDMEKGDQYDQKILL